MHLNTLGIVNGCIDAEAQAMAYATFPWNNTYGIKAFNESQYHWAMYELTRPGGAMDQLKECRRLQKKLDPNDHGDVERVTKYCQEALTIASNATIMQYLHSGKAGWFDITQPASESFPPFYATGFLNRNWVQQALAVPVNHSFVSIAVSEGFSSTADMARGGLVEDLAYILDHGVRVAMMYGDRDYACNWVGGEASSLKIPWNHAQDFEDAGYAPLVVSPVHSGGLTRQYGNLSFTRVYQAGHEVPSFQPEAAYKIFMRAVTGRDIATGEVDLDEVAAKTGEQYSTHGPSDTWWMKSDVLPAPARECYIWDVARCSDEEVKWIMDGTAIVKDWIVVGRETASQLDDGERGQYQMPLAAG